MATIFISYSHQDEDWKDRIVRQLRVLPNDDLKIWDDRRIEGGDPWEDEINTAIAGCDVALLLISANFLTSQYIIGKEVPSLLQRRQEQGVRVIPVILASCQWQRVAWLNSIQARPKDGKALSGMTHHDAETALSNLVGEIADLVAKSRQQGVAQNSEAPAATRAADSTPVELPSPATTLQKELVRLLAKSWSDNNLRVFINHYKSGLEWPKYFDALRTSTETYGDLLDLRIALGKSVTHGVEFSSDVSNAIALSALVLYERYNVASQGEAVAGISAANLLLAAIQATARHGTDAVVRGDDAATGKVSNIALMPGSFPAYRKNSETDPEWEEIKRSLSFSAEILLESIGEFSYRVMRDKFALREQGLAQRHPAISDGELRTKLQKAERELDGRFVYFVDHDDPNNLAIKHRDRIEREFGIRTVVWKRERESHDAAGQIDAIFELLFKTTRTNDESDTPPRPSPDSSGTTGGTWDKLNATLKKANETAEEGGKLLGAGASVVQKAGGLSAVWHVLKSLIS